MQNFIKTIINSVQSWTKKQIKNSTADWNENNSNADSYIKNRTHWIDEYIIVDNLTKSNYLNGKYPSCNFVEGDAYKVIYNDEVYDNLVCYFDGDYNIIASSDNGCPFYIDDDGGDNLYIETADDSADWTISIIKETIHQIDKKFVPQPDLSDVAYSGDYHDLSNIDTELSETSNNAVGNSTITAGINERLKLLDFNLPLSTQWQSVCYGDDTFIAIAGGNTSSNKVVYSIDGNIWKQSSLGGAQQFWKSVCYGNGKFVAVGRNINYTSQYTPIAYSTDKGASWVTTSRNLNDFEPESICYGNNMFIAVGTYGWLGKDTQTFIYSNDGVKWTQGSLPFSANWKSVCYGNGKYIAMTHGNKAAYSINGTHWIQIELPVSGNWNSICYGGDKFVATEEYYGNKVIYSTDGETWMQGSLPISASSICYGNDKFVAVGYDYDENSGTLVDSMIIYSMDGISWIRVTPHLSARWRSICYGNDKFVVISRDSDLAIYSTDGIMWKNKAILKYNEDVAEDVAMAVKPYLIDTIQSHINAPRFTLTLIDEVNGLDYIVAMQNGNLVTYRPTKSIAVTTMPNKTQYLDNDEFNPDGMVVMATDLDGSTREIYNYSYNSVIHYNNNGSCKFTITYTEFNNTFETTIDLNVLPFSLVDFEYIENDDGTYTITDWKGTYKGEPSTKIIIPDSELIIV